ncbi:MAG: DUF58 domain-containing protein [Phycisphaerae bacterium]|nr:DUF58 domain-containing protein [Phycisphaerae bacterium]
MRRRYHLHLPGLLYVLLTLVVGIAAANRPNNLLVWVFGAMLSGVLISGIVSGAMLMGVRGTRADPRRGVVGEPMIVRYAITNRARMWPAFNLQIEEMARGRDHNGGLSRAGQWSDGMRPAAGWVLHVGPGDTVHGEAVFFPQRRGRFVFTRFRVWTTFPFGFVRKSLSFDQRTETLVHPRVLALREDLLGALTKGGLGGFRLSSNVGPSEDYFGVREYRPGDSVRQIAWKRMAAGQGVVSIERSSATPPRLRVVVNLRTETAQLRVAEGRTSPREMEETAISIAASVIALAERQGYEVGLTVLGVPALRSPVRRGHWHIEKLMATLAAIDLDAPRDSEAKLPDADRDRSIIVAIHPDRAVPSIAPDGAWHLVSTQLATLVRQEKP